MISLNLTYEESKKILELGYDFSKVCVEFVETDKYSFQYKDKRKFVRINETQVLDSTTNLDDSECLEEPSWYDISNLHVIGDYLIPIIPKAALEACLPDYDDYSWYINEGKPCFIYEGGCTDNCQTGIFYLDQVVMRRIDSAYEAFLWCHENYQKELKKKFEEVMK